MKKTKPIFNLLNKKMLVYFILGISMIILFILIYCISASIGNSPSYTSYFRDNIVSNIGLTILMIFHAATLGLGILFLLIASYNISPTIKCFDNRFEIKHFFHNTNVILYDKISNIDTKVVLVRTTNPFKKNEKEILVDFKNPVYSFSFAYKTFGYFDDVKINSVKTYMNRKIYIKKEILLKIIEQINQKNKLHIPFLPEETKH